MDAEPTKTPKPIRVLVVDDHAAVCQGLALLLESEGIAACAQASGRAEALVRIAEWRPDLALVDLSLGDDDGMVLVADLHRLGIPVVVCSSHEDAEHVRCALAAGARAYVTKREAGTALVHAIRETLDGWILVSPRAAADLVDGS